MASIGSMIRAWLQQECSRVRYLCAEIPHWSAAQFNQGLNGDKGKDIGLHLSYCELCEQICADRFNYHLPWKQKVA